MTKLRSAQWKERQAALSDVTATLKANPRIAPGVGSLIESLRPRLKDNQVALVLAALGALGGLAKAVGRSIKMHLKAAVPDMLLLLGDGKAQVRDAAMDALDKWVGEISFEPLLPLLPKALAMEAPAGRAKLLAWVTTFVPVLSGQDDKLDALLPSVLKALDDRNTEVRSASTAALGALLSTGVTRERVNKCVDETFAKSQATMQKLRPVLDRLYAAHHAGPPPAAAVPRELPTTAAAADPAEAARPVEAAPAEARPQTARAAAVKPAAGAPEARPQTARGSAMPRGRRATLLPHKGEPPQGGARCSHGRCDGAALRVCGGRTRAPPPGAAPSASSSSTAPPPKSPKPAPSRLAAPPPPAQPVGGSGLVGELRGGPRPMTAAAPGAVGLPAPRSAGPHSGGRWEPRRGHPRPAARSRSAARPSRCRSLSAAPTRTCARLSPPSTTGRRRRRRCARRSRRSHRRSRTSPRCSSRPQRRSLLRCAPGLTSCSRRRTSP